MNLTIVGNRILNSDFASDDGTILFESKTPWSLTNPITVIKRFHPTTFEPEVIAEITWGKFFSSTTIKFKDGQVLKRGEFLKGPGFSPQRTITASDGRQYVWKAIMNAELFHKRPDGKEERVAYYVSGSIFKNRMPAIAVEPGWENILDSIMISFIIIEKMKRDRRAGGLMTTSAVAPASATMPST